jgi:hypothetical protein
VSRRRSRPQWAAGGSVDPVPDEVVEQAKAAYWTRAPGPVAAIVSDTAEEFGGRVVRFEHTGRRVELRLDAAAERWDLRGRVEPPQLRVELELDGAPVTVADDASGGRFAFEAVPPGVMRLRIVACEGAEPLLTDWFRA